jgi:putative endonuclease
MIDRRGVGMHGEELAARHLTSIGLTVLALNVRLQGGEIDLVARDDEDLVIVEVKTRIGDDSTAPDLAVTAAKLERLGRLADTYVSREGIDDTPWRVDVVAIVIGRSGRVLRIDHLRGAYL